MNMKVISYTVLLLLAICWPSYATELESVAKRQILNVVLIELDTSADAKLAKPVVNDWDYWNKCAGKLISRLESDIHYKRATKEVKEVNASLFAIRAAAKGLDDTQGLTPLIGELSRICKITRRPSFLILWLPRTKEVYLAVHDNRELDASVALAMIRKLRSVSENFRSLSGGEPSYVVPPCILWKPAFGSFLGPSIKATLDEIVTDSLMNDRLLHIIAGATVQVIVDTGIKVLAESSPLGAAWEHLTPTWDRTMDTAGDLIMEPLDISIAPGGVGPIVDLSPIRTWWREDWLRDTWRPAWSDFTSSQPGGILLQPELTITLDKSGLTSALASKAIAAVKGKTAGGEFMDEGKKYIAVKTPGTAQIFQVPAGKFHVTHTDIVVKTKDSTVLRLERFYDSSWSKVSVLGQGWSFQPFSLKFDQRVEAGDGKTLVALKPVLIDRQVGARLPYRLMKAESTTSHPPQKAIIAKYQKISSSLQPDLIARKAGGYFATFAHGFQIAFDSNGRMEWMGNSQADRVEYVFGSERLKEVRSAGGKIALLYDEKNCLTGAKSSSGQVVRYVLGNSGRLDSVTGSESGSFKFTYGADGRLATVSAIRGKQEPDLLFTNTYDGKGRMLTHLTPQGQWRFAYDDDIGRVIVTEPGGKQTSYYYDAGQRLVAYGSSKNQMTLFNYDITGRILQVAIAELLNDPSKSERPKFKVSEKIFPSPSAKGEEKG